MSATEKLDHVLLDKLRIDGGTQMRVKLNKEVVADYATKLTLLPPADVFFDGSDYWVADGIHRYVAHKEYGAKTMECRVHQGTQRDAVRFSLGANSRHGLHRTTADKGRAVETALADEEWGNWSNPKVAELCGVSDEFVRKIRGASSNEGEDRKVSRGGKTYTMSTGSIGKSKNGKKKEETAPPQNDDGVGKEKDDEPLPVIHDELDNVVDPELLGGKVYEDFADRVAFTAWIGGHDSQVRDLHKIAERRSGTHLKSWCQRAVDAAMRTVLHNVKDARPHAVCCYCRGKGCGKSDGCRGLGWLTKSQYETAPAELKTVGRKGAA